jgi:ribonucleoside-diphosphate reductase alpha chain
MAAARAPYVDQSQSLNLFIARPVDREALVDVPPRLEVRAQDDVLPAVAPRDPDPADDGTAVPTSPRLEAVACSLENPESCEACQ